MNWRVFVTIFLLLIIVFVATAMSPTVGNFLGSITNRFHTIIGDVNLPVSGRDVDFKLDIDKYGYIETTAKNPVNITIFEDKDKIPLQEYAGKIIVNGTKIFLDGSFSGLVYSDISIELKKTEIETSVGFKALKIEGMELDKLVVDDATGILVYNDIDININKKNIIIKSIIGDFLFNKTLSVEGAASSIGIDDMNIE